MNEQFKQWLERGGDGVFYTDRQRAKYIALQKCENIKMIYTLKDYKSYLGREKDFKYAGMYNEVDGKIYDGNYNCDFLSYEDRELTSIETISKQASEEVTRMILKNLDDSRDNLKIQRVDDNTIKENIAYFLDFEAPQLAREAYIQGKSEGETKRRFYTGISKFTEDEFIKYILDPVKYTADYTERYMEDNQELLLEYLIENEAITKEYRKILEDKTDNAHHVKGIIQAIKRCGAKTVNVTIIKNGVEFSFKTESSTLIWDHGENGTYGSWDICAQDRKKYKELYKWEDYKPEDIKKITYKKKVIYEKEV